MTKEELNLFQFPAIHMTELRAGSPEIVWCEMVQLDSLSAPSDDVPDDILGNSLSPRRPMSANRPEDSALGNLGRHNPTIDRFFDPHWHGHRSHVSALANQIDNGPMSLPVLHVLHFQSRKLGAP